MRQRLSLFIVLVAGSCVGCGGSGEIELKPDSSQAEVFQKLRAVDANVSLDESGKIIGVDFENPSHGDDAVAILKDIPTLKNVGLSGSGVTDAGLAHLEGLSGLETVGLEDTKVTARGAKKLRTALPDCRVSHGSGDE